MRKAAAIQRAAVREAHLQDALNENFARELEQALVLLNRRIRTLLRQLTAEDGRLVSTAANLGRAMQLRIDLRQALEDSGLIDLTREALDAPLDRLTKDVLSTQRIAARAAKLTGFDVNALTAFKELRLAELLEVTHGASDTIWRLVVDGVLGIRPVDAVLLDVEDALDSTAAEARTIYDTAVSTYSRQVEQLHATGEEDELFLYAGPIDRKTRDFCATRVGRVFTRDEIDSMDNGQLPNVMLTGGGYNCRHTWKRVSVLDEELTDLANSGTRVPEVQRRIDQLEEAAA